ncbi:MAG: protoporphyrinogen oxidase, partial [Gammaproteobacteria bacterium]|nr:protoporphyrinogen oxidase [Gammaproteobacteria bacterium]NIR82508.1 protoporphyrinogen oxidase [Gammaproteobacteria bacterium]NIU03639.1 protoporphyrinogen oxidase [Gammaproteobacteria bacterium]NIX84913.1 protoporphyrinogen oxidase [Gammaproteobacteria bacterium]
AVRTGVAVRRIRAVDGGFRIEAGAQGEIHACAVVIATQPHVAAQLLETVTPTGAEAAAAIEAPPLAVVFLGYRRRQVAHALDGLGYLTPSGERRNLTGALFCSTMFEGRAPRGHVALAGYVGGSRAPHLAGLCTGDLLDLARAEFSDLLGADGEPVVARVHRWARGLPQYNLGHARLAAALRATSQEVPGLYVTGNYLRGVSLGACVEQAVETAVRVDHFLSGIERSAKPAPGNRATQRRAPGVAPGGGAR